MQAIFYHRVATDEDLSSEAIREQERKVRKWAEKNGYQLLDYVDCD